MSPSATILLDSVSPSGTRLTTMRVTMPKFILAEFNTHRVFSRNAGSSRAISTTRRLKAVREHPFTPREWGVEQKGMSSSQTLDDTQSSIAQEIWESAAYQAADHAERLAQLGVHKQLVNRLVEPFTWVDVIVSSTLWQNFFTLRCHPAAQPEMRDVAEAMREAWLFNENITRLNHGEWHIPLLTAEEQAQFDKPEDMWLAAAGRIARVSYETSAKKSFEEDIALAKRLLESGHWSPFEHIARCAQGKSTFCRNFVLDWDQFRAFME